MLASSRAASISSRMQNDAGLYFKRANKRATAVRDLSPPDKSESDCNLLPGGDALISIPDSKTSPSMLISARPPLNRILKISVKFPEISSSHGQACLR